MERSEENTERNNPFLQEKSKSTTTSNHHKEYLGMELPDDYFASSKNAILNLVSEEKKKKTRPVFYLQRTYQVAASVAALIIFTVWFQLKGVGELEPLEIASDDILIESQFH